MKNEKIKVVLNDFSKVKEFLKVSRTFSSDIDVMTDHAAVDGKSILGVYALNLTEDTYTRIISDDTNECESFRKAMKEFEKW